MWDLNLFEQIFLFTWFPNGLKTISVSDFAIDCSWICEESEEGGTKKYDFVTKFFIFGFLKFLEI